MGNNKSAVKRQRQNKKQRIRNRIFKSQVKTIEKNFTESIKKKIKENAENSYKQLSVIVDKAVSKGVFHKNTAARKKSRMYNLLKKV